MGKVRRVESNKKASIGAVRKSATGMMSPDYLPSVEECLSSPMIVKNVLESAARERLTFNKDAEKISPIKQNPFGAEKYFHIFIYLL